MKERGQGTEGGREERGQGKEVRAGGRNRREGEIGGQKGRKGRRNFAPAVISKSWRLWCRGRVEKNDVAGAGVRRVAITTAPATSWTDGRSTDEYNDDDGDLSPAVY